MSAYILDAVCAHQQSPYLGWAWTPSESSVYTYCRLFSKCSFYGVIIQFSNHFVTLVYKIIFKQDPPCMSHATIESLIDIANWYASPLGTFIQMYIAEKALHVLPKFLMDKLVMQEVSYHISTRLSTRLHWRKNPPWPSLPLQIRLYEILNLNHGEAKREEFKIFTLGTRIFNLYDPHYIVKDYCTRVKHPWIHEAFHWPEEDPRRYCYHFLAQ